MTSWETMRCEYMSETGQQALAEVCADGWEPFAVTRGVYHLRRNLESAAEIPVPPAESDDEDKMTRPKIRVWPESTDPNEDAWAAAEYPYDIACGPPAESDDE